MWEAAAAGEELASQLELGTPLCAREGLSVCNATRPDGEEVLAVSLEAEAPKGSIEAFERIAQYGGLGGLTVERTGNMIVATPAASGTLVHLAALQWSVPRRVDLFMKIARVVKLFHREDMFAGALVPEYILLDHEFEPLLLGPAFAPSVLDYEAPEVVSGRPLNRRSDVYCLGRLLHFLLLQETPPRAEVTDPAKLEELVAHPAGLSRIIRKATRIAPKDRYPSVAAMIHDVSRYGRYDEVGITHPDVKEENFGGLSLKAPPPERPKEKTTYDDEDANVVDQLAAATGKLAEAKPFRLSGAARAILLIGGVVGVATAFAINYVAGDPMWIRLALTFAAGLVGFALLSPGINKESLLRTLLAVLFANATYVSNPTRYVASIAERAGLRAENLEKREEAFVAQRSRGKINFVGVDLAGADLRERSFLFTNMEGASFEGADLTGATLISTKLDGARFRGAILVGASIQSSVDYAVDFDQAECDETTILPGGWSCVDGHPKKSAIKPQSKP